MMFLLLINPQKQSQNHRENVPGVLFRRIPPKQDDVKHPERKENKKGKMLSRTENKKKLSVMRVMMNIRKK